ncbi:MAG TPA: 16S rRNA (guanine(527)-N(7))-methyltransferase RsmG [Candidatus Limiplasma sp.]|nr:16S rRNA (guanine(527)-N(7))-methyltransferase RsmG [Candidatus Limiplasma sp.]HRX08317.1 16S rRNA (guanine(527)-N(7))-methyltransferase RsmG [Candidatus Limiplasma sp.]
MTAEKQALVEERLSALQITCDADAAKKLVKYQELVETWNERINLTGDASFEAMLDRHLMDSLTPLTVEGLIGNNASLIDVGSGAGLPGMPLAIARPDLRVTLLDSMQKRVVFLQTVVQTLSLANVSVLHARAEDAAQNAACRERFDIATARAVAALPVLQELLLPFVRVGGKCVCLKGPAAEDELLAGAAAAGLLGGGSPEMVEIALPFAPDLRHVLAITEKHSQTPKRYPRRSGTPAKNPLGV